jgi:hypothetical protein
VEVEPGVRRRFDGAVDPAERPQHAARGPAARFVDAARWICDSVQRA